MKYYKIVYFNSFLLQTEELLNNLLNSLQFYLDNDNKIKDLFNQFFNLIKKFNEEKNYIILLINFYNLILQELLNNKYSNKEKKLIWLLSQVINIIIELYYKIFNEELKQVL